MTPSTRREIFLAAIIAGSTLIPTPETRPEAYLAKIAGVDVGIPSPVTREEMYLYKIAGGSIIIPTPITRLETYMAYKCGMSVNLPTPVTREEDLWNKIATGWEETTITGIPPLSFKADGSPLISWSMKGNGSQSGTPSPQNIIMPEMCGVRTWNLFDKNAPDRTTTGYVKSDGSIQSSTSFSTSGYIPISGFATITLSGYGGGNEPAYCLYDSNKDYLSGSAYTGRETITLTVGTAAFIRMSYRNTAVDMTMLNLGSTALPYEPYGWKIPITCAGQTVPVYLGQTQTVRKIRKLVLTGSESWIVWNGNYFSSVIDNMTINNSRLFCTHFVDDGTVGIRIVSGSAKLKVASAAVSDFATDLASFKAYLAAQYANGTPVTIWYVLAEPTTGIVNEPLAKIGDYADELNSTDAEVTIPTVKGQNTLTVDTELQPSEMTITGNIAEPDTLRAMKIDAVNEGKQINTEEVQRSINTKFETLIKQKESLKPTEGKKEV